MAKPGPAADRTAACEGGETVIVPAHSPDDAVDLAWSNDDSHLEDNGIGSEPTAARESWGATWNKAGVLLMVGLGLAGVIVVGGWVFSAPRPPPTASAQSSAPTAPAKTSTSAAAPSSTADQDSAYLQALNDRGISFANPEAAVYNGKVVCQNIRQGMTVQQVVAAFRASNPALSANANAYVDISIHTYCP